MFSKSSRLKEIRSGCFAESGLKMFETPPSLRKIGNRAFLLCKNLQRVALNEGLETVGTDDEESTNEIGVFRDSGIKEIVLPGTLVKLSKKSFEDCRSLERVWVEQHCKISIKDYVQSDVDVRVFRAGDKIPLSSAGKDE